MYKLINKQTNEEHICSKVVIDGFDYYVSDDELVNGDIIIYPLGCEPPQYIHLRKVTNTHSHGGKELCDTYLSESAYIRFEWSKKVIATNNASIDLPKVIDEVDLISMKFLLDGQEIYTAHAKDNNSSTALGGFLRGSTHGYNKSQESHPFSEEDMIEFSLFYYKHQGKTLEYWGKDLFEIWKEQRIKTIYYV